jgi:vacuolar-type H+-ATPase subunit E/Vma4
MYSSGVTNRRKRVFKKLTTQLKAGTKTLKDGVTIVPLTESDVKRIEKEIETLKTKI